MRFDVISVLPEIFSAVTELGVTGRAFRNGLAELNSWNPRDYAKDRHKTVDDRVYGGGPGMVMMVEPLERALSDIRAAGNNGPLVYLSPQGKTFDQAMAQSILQQKEVVLLAGRYEGVDERFVASAVDIEVSLGDFVTSGGELPAMLMVDAITRLIPGALGHSASAEQDSFSDGLLDYPHYTRPEAVNGAEVPKVLMSGDHEKIRRWRLQQSLVRTSQRRPELLQQRGMNKEEQQLFKAWQPPKE